MRDFEQYAKWFKDTRQAMTPMQKLEFAKLKKSDDLCEVCFNGNMEAMLCDGVRPYFDTSASDMYNRPVTHEHSCAKLRYKREQHTVVERLRRTGIPWNIVKRYGTDMLLSAVQTPDELIVGGNALPVGMYEEHSNPLEALAFRVSLSVVYNGMQSKYFLVPVALAQYNRWKDLLVEYGDGVAFLTLARFDMGSAPYFILDMLHELVNLRYNLGLPTLVTVGAQPKARTDKELELYESMLSWSTLSEIKF